MRYDEVRAILKKHFAELVAKRKASIAENGRLDQLEIASLENGAAFALQALSDERPINPVGDDTPTLDALIAKYNLPVERGSPGYANLHAELKRAYLAYCRSVLAYDRSLDGYDFTGADGQHSGKQSALPAMTLQAAVKSFMDDRRMGAAWAHKTLGERTAHINLLYEMFGEGFDIRSFGPEQTKQTKDTLGRYPKNRRKDPRTRKCSLNEALKVEGVEKIDALTVNKYLQTYNALFGWAEANQHIDKNPFKGSAIRITKKKKASKPRLPFDQNAVALMLRELKTDSFGLIKKNHHKWATLIGLYTGARLNEISQLHLHDIRQKDGLWCFDLNDDDEGKRLKTEASRRIVPVHQTLLDLGLLEHVAEMKAKQAPRLFPDLILDKNNGWGRNQSRWFNVVFLVKLGLKSKQLVFHSLRHTVFTRLSQADVPEEIINAIIGHAQDGVGQQHYFDEGYTLQQLSNALAKLPY